MVEGGILARVAFRRPFRKHFTRNMDCIPADVIPVREQLNYFLNKVDNANSISALDGIEGTCAGKYFSIFNSFLTEKYGEVADYRATGEHEGHVYLEHMDTQRDGDGTFKRANEIIADSLGVSTRDVQDYMKARNLTWHEVGDRHTVRAVPSEINQVFGHTGGIGIQKDIEALSSNVQEAVDHSPISLQRTSDVVHLSNSGDIEKSIEQAHELNQSTKKNMFGKK